MWEVIAGIVFVVLSFTILLGGACVIYVLWELLPQRIKNFIDMF